MVTLRHVVGRISRDNPRLRRYLSFDYFRRKEGKTAREVQLFIIILESSDSDIKKPVANAAPENTKKVKKNMLSTSFIIMITSFKSQIVLAEHECSTNWGDCKSKRGKPECPEKNLSEQS